VLWTSLLILAASIIPSLRVVRLPPDFGGVNIAAIPPAVSTTTAGAVRQ
jgi:hypothetical protein